MPVQLASLVGSRQTSNPKTVLGFYATVLGIVLVACVVAAIGLGETKTDTWLIPWILGFAALVAVLLIVGVFVVNLRDPSKLMLGQVTAAEYLALHRALLGDNVSGEHVQEFLELLVPPPSPSENVITASDEEHRLGGPS